VNTTPSINLAKVNYDAIIRMGLEPTEIVNELAVKFVEENQKKDKSQ
jgi:hypothetical protein